MKLIFTYALIGVLFLAGCSSSEVSYEIKEVSSASETSEVSDDKSDEATSDEEASESIYVYVCGEVEAPGVYELSPGSRVYEAIEAAGGLLEGVDETGINMAQVLADGQQITVNSEGAETVSDSAADASGTDGADGKVNINTADKDELMTLTGIGEARAEAIIEYRESYGSFSAIEEITNISGIGDKMFEKIKDDIEV